MDESSSSSTGETERVIRSYRDLHAWQAAMELAEACYEVTARLPEAERFGLRVQRRDAAVSIASNIAEGYCRRGRRAYLHHLRIAKGSHGELDTQLELVKRLELVSTGGIEGMEKCVTRTGQLLSGLILSIDRTQP